MYHRIFICGIALFFLFIKSRVDSSEASGRIMFSKVLESRITLTREITGIYRDENILITFPNESDYFMVASMEKGGGQTKAS
ncbi:MAG: hypothetical protein HQK54_12685, partial [Oligoflexales bacterium]|nr:hypothetical protein [Oligoflexales bacterium]